MSEVKWPLECERSRPLLHIGMMGNNSKWQNKFVSYRCCRSFLPPVRPIQCQWSVRTVLAYGDTPSHPNLASTYMDSLFHAEAFPLAPPFEDSVEKPAASDEPRRVADGDYVPVTASGGGVWKCRVSAMAFSRPMQAWPCIVGRSPHKGFTIDVMVGG